MNTRVIQGVTFGDGMHRIMADALLKNAVVINGIKYLEIPLEMLALEIMYQREDKEWCDYDYVAAYIRNVGYEPETTMENIITIIFLHYEGELERKNKRLYAVKETRQWPDCLMVNTEDVEAFVNDSGGLREFDYFA